MNVQCCVVGGGPAGMMLGTLLARQGVEVVVLEKHADFLRDFRGDTIHPSTQELIHELGWLDEFHRLPHSTMDRVTVAVGGTPVTFADFRKLPVRSPYIAFMPQWEFLNFLATKAATFPGFRLLQRTEATDLLIENERVLGVRATTDTGSFEIRADLVVAADGPPTRIGGAGGFGAGGRGAARGGEVGGGVGPAGGGRTGGFERGGGGRAGARRLRRSRGAC
ncbi:FAD-dependent monooxygenase, partial [Nocardia abscessus]|uniref:FAD-dependent monooxygenase n=1 Tax=Nocardia abscessus TaxID=120957 RepID=UPI002456FC36